MGDTLNRGDYIYVGLQARVGILSRKGEWNLTTLLTQRKTLMQLVQSASFLTVAIALFLFCYSNNMFITACL